MADVEMSIRPKKVPVPVADLEEINQGGLNTGNNQGGFNRGDNRGGMQTYGNPYDANQATAGG